MPLHTAAKQNDVPVNVFKKLIVMHPDAINATSDVHGHLPAACTP